MEKDETALTGEFTLRSTNSTQKPTQSVKTDVMHRTGFFHTERKERMLHVCAVGGAHTAPLPSDSLEYVKDFW